MPRQSIFSLDSAAELMSAGGHHTSQLVLICTSDLFLTVNKHCTVCKEHAWFVKKKKKRKISTLLNINLVFYFPLEQLGGLSQQNASTKRKQMQMGERLTNLMRYIYNVKKCPSEENTKEARVCCNLLLLTSFCSGSLIKHLYLSASLHMQQLFARV